MSLKCENREDLPVLCPGDQVQDLTLSVAKNIAFLKLVPLNICRFIFKVGRFKVIIDGHEYKLMSLQMPLSSIMRNVLCSLS